MHIPHHSVNQLHVRIIYGQQSLTAVPGLRINRGDLFAAETWLAARQLREIGVIPPRTRPVAPKAATCSGEYIYSYYIQCLSDSNRMVVLF